MSNNIILWKAKDLTQINDKYGIEVIEIHNKALKISEIKKIKNAFENSDYDMAIEYAWRRAIRAIKAKFSKFDDSLLLELLDRNQDETIDVISDLEYIRVATDLGILSKTAQLKLTQIHEVINHYLYGEVDEDDELNYAEATSYIVNMTKYIFSKPLDESSFDYEIFRDHLVTKRLSVEDIEVVKQSDYYYKRVTIRTLFNLVEKIESGQIEIVYTNMNLLFQSMWSTLADEDKFKIGKRYSEAVLNNESELSSALRRTLTSISGFDFVPENLRSNTYIRYANELLSAHKSFDNFFLEPDKARQLAQLGSSIPLPALPRCTTAILSSKLGNSYGFSFDAQQYVEKMLKTYNVSRWEYYFNKALPFDEDILTKITKDRPFERWVKLLNDSIDIEDINFKDAGVKRLIRNSLNDNLNGVRTEVAKLVSKLRV